MDIDPDSQKNNTIPSVKYFQANEKHGRLQIWQFSTIQLFAKYYKRYRSLQKAAGVANLFQFTLSLSSQPILILKKMFNFF